jgi:DNA-binding beta-propeller fold protein YncE
MRRAVVRHLLFCLPFLGLFNTHCGRSIPSFPPPHYLLVTHPALNRISIFDLATNKIIGALPTHKLPHDMVISRDHVLYVVNSGSQCITTYDLKNPEFWKYARDFVKQDSANLYASRSPSANMMGLAQTSNSRGVIGDTAAWKIFNRDPVQAIPASFAHTSLTDTLFPESAKPMHEKAGAFSHNACYDCHDRSVGGRPFGPVFTNDSSTLVLVHLRGRNITFLDSRTLTIQRQIPLPISVQYSPIEIWIVPDQSKCFVTCRNEIGQSRQGTIIVVDLRSGKLLKSIEAGIYPWHLLADPTNTRLYVNNFQSSRISIVDVAKEAIVDSLIVQNGPAMMLLQPERNVLFVSCFYTDRILAVNLASKQVEQTIDVDSNPTSLEFSRDKKTLYVLCGGESSLDIVDVASGTVSEKHKMLFGAYAFHPVDDRQLRQ